MAFNIRRWSNAGDMANFPREYRYHTEEDKIADIMADADYFLQVIPSISIGDSIVIIDSDNVRTEVEVTEKKLNAATMKTKVQP